jgi:hypothetical protein
MSISSSGTPASDSPEGENPRPSNPGVGFLQMFMDASRQPRSSREVAQTSPQEPRASNDERS